MSFADASPFAGRRRLTVQVRFAGNSVLLPRAAATRTVAALVGVVKEQALTRPAHPAGPRMPGDARW